MRLYAALKTLKVIIVLRKREYQFLETNKITHNLKTEIFFLKMYKSCDLSMSTFLKYYPKVFFSLTHSLNLRGHEMCVICVFSAIHLYFIVAIAKVNIIVQLYRVAMMKKEIFFFAGPNCMECKHGTKSLFLCYIYFIQTFHLIIF